MPDLYGEGFERLERNAHAICDAYGYPMKELESPIELAKRLNTYKQRDRSMQYQDPSGPAILRSINHLWHAKRELDSMLKLMFWIMGAEGAIIGWLAHELLKRL